MKRSGEAAPLAYSPEDAFFVRNGGFDTLAWRSFKECSLAVRQHVMQTDITDETRGRVRGRSAILWSRIKRARIEIYGTQSATERTPAETAKETTEETTDETPAETSKETTEETTEETRIIPTAFEALEDDFAVEFYLDGAAQYSRIKKKGALVWGCETTASTDQIMICSKKKGECGYVDKSKLKAVDIAYPDGIREGQSVSKPRFDYDGDDDHWGKWSGYSWS